jgi:hypothetical protein
MGIKCWEHFVFATVVSTVGLTGCGDSGKSAEATFAQRLEGTFKRVAPVPAPGGNTAYLAQTLLIEDSEEPNTVTQSLTAEAFFDQALTQRVLKYDSKGPCKVIRKSTVPGAFDVDCTNDSSFLTVFQTDPALLQGLGIDDCNLTEGVAKDISNGCAAPTFQVSACADQDIFWLSEDGKKFMWGDYSPDRCVKRPTALDPEAFDRLP